MESFSQSNAASWAKTTTLEVTTKATEMEDNLFDDASSISSEHAAPVAAQNLDVPIEARPATSRTSTEKSCGKSDSGYSSASSVSSGSEARKMKLKTFLQDKHKRSKSMVTDNPAASNLPTQNVPPVEGARPPLLQRLSLPAMQSVKTLQLNESVNSIATYDSAQSVQSVQKTKSRRLQKKRNSLHSRSVSSIVIQSQEELCFAQVPPVPPSISSTLSERVRVLPELQRTYNNVGKTEDEEDQSPFEPIELRFPSPVEEEERSHHRRSWIPDLGAKPKGPRPEHKRSRSFFSRRGRADKTSKLPGECDSDTAFAIIQDTETLFNTSHIASGNVMLHGRPIPSQRYSYAGPSPSPDAYVRADMRSRRTMTGMDAETAANLARNRSKILSEHREASMRVHQRSFDGLQGRNPKQFGIATDAPPMPPLSGLVNRRMEPATSLDVPEIRRSRPVSMPVQQYPEQGPSYTTDHMTPHNLNAEYDMSAENIWTSITIPSRQPTPSTQSFSGRMSQTHHTGSWSAPRDTNFSRPRSAWRSSPSTQDQRNDTPSRNSFLGHDEVNDLRWPSPAPSQLSEDLTPRFGRYSGGLQYGYHHGKGIVGSAGSRSFSGEKATERKSVQLSEGYGIDLSDVPVIARVQRVC
ncbi:hypothetical protein UCRPC4_g00183 [Phaeomoniella chlamydospora]|uniref:Uncharacterized protein n=1 Tax=Phaeomoniella chlamydospora TaxID=158046 RepID=A0A0G2F408_PHACM|nr:hypothetical protein UCRPC4_g00183 [Phaeomoniella chlamydospora]